MASCSGSVASARPVFQSTTWKSYAESAADRILGLPEASRVLIGFPVSAGGTPIADLVDRLQKRGFQRVLVDGDAVPLTSIGGNGHAADALVVVVDRIGVGPEARARVVEALETAAAAQQPVVVALAAAQAAAEQGMQHTIGLQANKGRASYLGPRAIGHQDPGATSAFFLVAAAAATLGQPVPVDQSATRH